MSTKITFDIKTGTFVCDTTGSFTFPEGVYTFKVKITIGSVEKTVVATVILQKKFPAYEQTIIKQPDEQNFHFIGDGKVAV